MERQLEVKQKYLLIPIQPGFEGHYLEIFADDHKLYEFKIPAGKVTDGEYHADFYARIPIENEIGKILQLKGDFPVPFFELIHTGDLADEQVIKIDRPQIHFTPDSGWINDPNGLVYDGQRYHLFFQYNPFDTQWENMSWGHAVSEDLLHWEQWDTALFPDANGTMFSGCGIKNDRGLLGVPKDALLFFYTAAGDTSPWSKEQPFTQRIAVSTDGGRTLRKLEQPYIGKIGKDTRDPKIFWHGETNAYIMILYVEDNDFAIYRSEDLADWTQTQRFCLDKAWECPDLMQIPMEDGSTCWMFWSADGFYYWGEFDGYQFISDGVRHEAYMNRIPYAAQTYSGVGKRVISVPWVRLPNEGRSYTGAMGIPREFSGRRIGDSYVLVQNETEELRKKWRPVSALSQNHTYKAVVNIGDSKADVLQLEINGSTLRYDAKKGVLQMDEESVVVGEHLKDISLIVDGNILEVSVLNGIMLGIYNLNMKEQKFTYQIPETVSLLLFEMEE